MENKDPFDDLENHDGSAVENISLDDYGVVLPPKHNKIALIDADTVAFTACLAAEEETTEFDENNNEVAVFVGDPLEALQNAEDKIQRILDRTGCQTAELYFTGGRENFRYVIFPDYKANRRGPKAQRAPVNLAEVKQLLLERYEGNIATGWEADDMVVYLKKHNPDKYIMCAVDKDVLNSVPGEHFNYYESSQRNKDMTFVEVSEKQAKMWPYLQTILGDTSDNVPGCKGIGIAKAAKFINEDMTEEELWDGVLTAYSSKGMTAEQAQLTMQLVNMHTLAEVNGKLQVQLWQGVK